MKGDKHQNDELSLLTLRNGRCFLRFQLISKIVHSFQWAGQPISHLPRRSNVHTRELRDDNLLHLHVLRARTTMGQSTFQYLLQKTKKGFQHSQGAYLTVILLISNF